MVDKFKFSIIIAVYNVEDYLDETINSIIDQDIGFEDNVQLILVDDGSTDNSKNIALTYQKQYPKNIIVVSKENGGQSSARNLGLKYATGEYVNFLDSDDKLTLNTLREVYSFFMNHDTNIIAIPLIFFDRINGNHTLNRKFNRNSLINVYDTYNYPQLSIASCFIKTILFNDFSFDERLNIGEDAVLINKLLVNEGKIAFIKDAHYLYRKRNDTSSTLDSINLKKEFYLDKSRFFHVELINYCLSKLNKVPKFIQYVITHDMQWYYNEVEIFEILSKEEYGNLMEEIKFVLSFIDSEIILNHSYLSNDKKNFLIYLKNGDFHIVAKPKRNKVFLKSNDFIINKLHNHKIHIDIIEINNNNLIISGLFASNCRNEAISIDAVKENSNGLVEFISSEYIQYKTTYRHTNVSLNIPWKFYYNFDLKIPINNNCKISLKVKYNENDNEVNFNPKIKFRDYSNLSEYSNYFIKDDYIILFDNNVFQILEYTSKLHLKLELLSIFKILTSLEAYDAYAILIHILYLITFPFLKNKRIWLFIDRKDVADDNAKHLFKYVISQEDSFEKFFIVDKKSEDYKKMLKISKNIVPFGSLKHKLLYLYSDKIISSHVNHEWINPFFYKNRKLFSGLTSFQKYFLQHGVTKDDVSIYLKKFSHNLHLFLTLSKYEYDSIFNGNYNYSKNVVQLLGFPRYDNLKNINNKKQILFMPTWRSNLTKDNFNNSIYFLRLNSLLNNKRLMEILKKNDYNFIFKPHLNLLPFLDSINIPNEIKISIDTPYQDLFNNSSLMITDYSSVAFDFAYIKKPLIYYQNDDYHYEKGYFDYETMGFGDIIQTEEELIDKIIEYIENNCQMEEKYQKRVDKFFKYTDKNNSKRVYEWILKN